MVDWIYNISFLDASGYTSWKYSSLYGDYNCIKFSCTQIVHKKNVLVDFLERFLFLERYEYWFIFVFVLFLRQIQNTILFCYEFNRTLANFVILLWIM